VELEMLQNLEAFFVVEAEEEALVRLEQTVQHLLILMAEQVLHQALLDLQSLVAVVAAEAHQEMAVKEELVVVEMVVLHKQAGRLEAQTRVVAEVVVRIRHLGKAQMVVLA
jgi:hypothetical protein